MGEPEKQVIRRKLLGALLRHARSSAGRSQAELATALHVSKYRYAQYEQGQQDLALPELELLAQLCGVPLGYFFDDEATVEDSNLEVSHLTAPRIRRKVVGTLLRQARQNAGKSQKDCAAILDMPPRRLSEYERGERDIPSSELEALAPHLGVPVDYFAV
jgi:transcriptional regulator with XRE-family HTH domain